MAVSGGADSVAMAHALAGLKKQGDLSCEFVIGHINHCLRGAESDADEVFVKQLGQSLDLPVISVRVDVRKYAAEHKLSIETAARVLRLKTLAQMAEQNSCGCIATAHHKDDLAETMIHRLMRGTGFRGLCGIWPVSEVYGAEFVRPMLGLRRDEIIQYCKDNSIQWRQDASNADVNFTRNHIRHHLLPILENESDAIVDKLEELSLASRKFQLFTEKHARTIVDKGNYDPKAGEFTFKQELLRDIAVWVFYEVAREVLVKLGVGLRRYKREHFKMLQQLIGKKRSSLVLPDGVVVWTMGDRLLFIKASPTAEAKSFPPAPDKPVQLDTGQTIIFGRWQVSSRLLNPANIDIASFMTSKDAYVEWLDADKIVGGVRIRCRKEGDRFWPIGAGGQKKVGRFLIDAQLDAEAKKQAFIIEDAEKILWVAPVRMSERGKITEKTQKIFEIKVSLPEFSEWAC